MRATLARLSSGSVLYMLLLAALAIRLTILPSPGNVSDVMGFAYFGTQVLVYGPQALYDSPWITTTYYVTPPLFPFLLGATYGLWALLAGVDVSALKGAEDIPFPPPYPVAAGLLKLWSIAGDLALGAVVYAWVGRRAGGRWAAASAAAFLFNPGFIYDSAWWGQIESLFVLCIAMALVSLTARRVVPAWLWIAGGLLVKPQVIVALPVLGLITLTRFGLPALARGVVAAGALVVVCTAPLWATGRIDPLIATYTRVTAVHPQVSVNAYNTWWALGGPGDGLPGMTDATPFAGSLTYRQAGLALLAGYLALVAWRLGAGSLLNRSWWRRAGTPSLAGAWPSSPAGAALPFVAAAGLYVAFFMLPTQIHERYLYTGLALLCFLLYRDPLLPVLYAVLSITFFANLVRVVPWDASVVVALDALGFTSWAVAVLNVVAFVTLSFVLLRATTQTGGDGAAVPQRAARASQRHAVIAATATAAVFGVAVQLAPPARYQPAAIDPLILFVAWICLLTAGSAVRRRMRPARTPPIAGTFVPRPS